jgi:hypothetical protein
VSWCRTGADSPPWLIHDASVPIPGPAITVMYPKRRGIQVRPIGGDEWSIRAADAVGVIVVGSLRFLVQPKVN